MTPLLVLSLMVMAGLLIVFAVVTIGSWQFAQMINRKLQAVQRRLVIVEQENRVLRASLSKCAISNVALNDWQKITGSERLNIP